MAMSIKTERSDKVENEIRYYLGEILDMMEPVKLPEVDAECYAEGATPLKEFEPYVPQYIVTAVKLPTDAIEIAINDKNIADKIKYILEAYDDDMHLKTNTAIIMQNIMIV